MCWVTANPQIKERSKHAYHGPAMGKRTRLPRHLVDKPASSLRSRQNVPRAPSSVPACRHARSCPSAWHFESSAGSQDASTSGLPLTARVGHVSMSSAAEPASQAHGSHKTTHPPCVVCGLPACRALIDPAKIAYRHVVSDRSRHRVQAPCQPFFVRCPTPRPGFVRGQQPAWRRLTVITRNSRWRAD